MYFRVWLKLLSLILFLGIKHCKYVFLFLCFWYTCWFEMHHECVHSLVVNGSSPSSIHYFIPNIGWFYHHIRWYGVTSFNYCWPFPHRGFLILISCQLTKTLFIYLRCLKLLTCLNWINFFMKSLKRYVFFVNLKMIEIILRLFYSIRVITFVYQLFLDKLKCSLSCFHLSLNVCIWSFDYLTLQPVRILITLLMRLLNLVLILML